MSGILIVDGNSILNRAFYGIRNLNAPDGTPTNALYGTVNILNKHLSALSPEYATVAFDIHAPTFRHKIYSEYKAGRHETPPELIQQLSIARELISAMGIKVLEKEGYEADDILGTVARMANGEDVDAYILTGDRDSLQLVGDRTKVILAGNKEDVVYDENVFRQKYGISPDSFVELKAMMGDSSDNIPGIAGVGEKTAISLVEKFGSVQGLYDRFEESDLRPKLKEKIANSRENAFLSRKLVEITTEVPLEITLEDCRYYGPAEEIVPLFTKLGFNKFLSNMNFDSGKSVAAEKRENKEIDVKEIASSDLKLENGEKISCVISDGKLLVCGGETVYSLPFDKETLKRIKESSPFIIVYDAKAFYKETASSGVPIKADFDIMLAEYLLNSSSGQKNAAELCLAYFGYQSDGDIDICAELLNLYNKMDSDFDDEEKALYYNTELPLAFVLADMEEVGFYVDIPELKKFGEELDARIESYTSAIYDYAGGEFNINSPKQLGEVLFDKLGLPAYKKTKNGYSTNAEVLEGLIAAHPIISLILEYRAAAKLKSTYVDGLCFAAGASEDGRVHTSFNQNITATGRLSSTEPNLQNIPIRTELGRNMRKFFVARDGYYLIDADYSQIELRILAAVSGDKNMIDAFNRGVDIHTATAATAFGIGEEFVTPELRKRAKAVNFGIVYGIGEFSLAKDIGVTRKKAGEYIKAYLSAYPGVKRYLDESVEKGKKDGYVKTLTGRKRYIPELASSRKQLQAFGERVAKNSPIQGAAADIIKIAMINVSSELAKECPGSRLILQVHDELIVESPADEAERAAAILKKEMENAVKLEVPLTVDIKTAKSWYDAH